MSGATEPMTAERLREIRERLNGLLASTCCINIQVEIPFGSRESEVSARACAETITNASSDIADLLAEVERLRQQNEQLTVECTRRAVLLAHRELGGYADILALCYVLGIEKDVSGRWIVEFNRQWEQVRAEGLVLINQARQVLGQGGEGLGAG